MGAVEHHTKPAGTDSGDGKVSKNYWGETHDVDWAELADLVPPGGFGAVGSLDEIPRADHQHPDSVGSRIYLSQNAR